MVCLRHGQRADHSVCFFATHLDCDSDDPAKDASEGWEVINETSEVKNAKEDW